MLDQTNKNHFATFMRPSEQGIPSLESGCFFKVLEIEISKFTVSKFLEGRVR